METPEWAVSPTMKFGSSFDWCQDKNLSYIWAKINGQLSLPFGDVRVTFIKHTIAMAEAPALAKASSLSTLYEIKHLPFWFSLFHLIFGKEEKS